jgi:hypothetical protein
VIASACPFNSSMRCVASFTTGVLRVIVLLKSQRLSIERLLRLFLLGAQAGELGVVLLPGAVARRLGKPPRSRSSRSGPNSLHRVERLRGTIASWVRVALHTHLSRGRRAGSDRGRSSAARRSTSRSG